MGKIEVYKRDYEKSNEEDYYDLIGKIKKNSFRGMPSEREFLTFDGDFLLKISMDMSKSYSSENRQARIMIEKVGPNPEINSEIENLLIEEGFKKESRN